MLTFVGNVQDEVRRRWLLFSFFFLNVRGSVGEGVKDGRSVGERSDGSGVVGSD